MLSPEVKAMQKQDRDGSGLPFGLRGKEIPIEARIVAFVDHLDNYLEDEENEDFISFDTAFDRVVNDIGSKFDPELGAVFVKCRKEMKEIYMGLENL